MKIYLPPSFNVHMSICKIYATPIQPKRPNTCTRGDVPRLENEKSYVFLSLPSHKIKLITITMQMKKLESKMTQGQSQKMSFV